MSKNVYKKEKISLKTPFNNLSRTLLHGTDTTVAEDAGIEGMTAAELLTPTLRTTLGDISFCKST